MPTDPRYMLTDAGDVARAVDAAASRWPGTARPELLRRLIAHAGAQLNREARVERQRLAARAIPELVDRDVLLGDDPWR